ncbi:hypothetical protein Pmani_011834 [Petrolisthes manimaculis]|uniref:Ig-like domain-containing protein n=1 Tax=Petrolisthes manimaculis TaxID=1843537 RepID=A0AAE1Q218_9EUCA|nr:hypothetical protein Pmani_011834 [Petrolisthes manimaculis]
MWSNWTLSLLFVLYTLTLETTHTAALRITRIQVPEILKVGDSSWLECDFDEVVGGGKVYALKWYLGLHEFYRWMPAESPTVKAFPPRDQLLVVDEAASHRGRVRIKNVRLGATGVFRCEVSEEAPAFHTEAAVANLTVFDPPDTKPRITGLRTAYQLGEEVEINCSSPRSHPPATLTFFINNEEASASWLTHYPPLEYEDTVLETSTLGLQFVLKQSHLGQGSVEVKCIASIKEIHYRDISIEYVHINFPIEASVMEGHTSRCIAQTTPTRWMMMMMIMWIMLMVVVMYW